MASPGPLQKVFDDAKREFENELPGTRFQDLLTVTTIDQLYDVLDKLQGQQRRLRHLERIQPFLDRLQSFAGVIEVFVQAKPEILSLIWGPIKLLLKFTAEWQQGYDAMIKTVGRIGELLPQFQDVLEHFIDKKHIQDVLGLLYRDILDFYLESLSFFTMKGEFLAFILVNPFLSDARGFAQIVISLNRPTHDVRDAVAKAEGENQVGGRQHRETCAAFNRQHHF